MKGKVKNRMSKKKKKKKNKSAILGNEVLDNLVDKKSKKSLNKDFKHTLNEIQQYQMELYEADKKSNKKLKNKKKINKKEYSFYTDMESIKKRKKMAKDWEKSGFLDRILDMIENASPFIKLIAKALCMLIITFLSLDVIKKKISPTVLSKITKVFDIAIAL